MSLNEDRLVYHGGVTEDDNDTRQNVSRARLDIQLSAWQKWHPQSKVEVFEITIPASVRTVSSLYHSSIYNIWIIGDFDLTEQSKR